jgi:predicted nucleic acid-binding Zn ribbon protein
MPTYTIECVKCLEKTTVYRSLADHGKWPKHCGRKMRQVYGKVNIIKDIQPYRATAHDVRTGGIPVITGRRDHQEYLRANGYEEIGNEKPKPQGEASRNLEGPQKDVVHALKQVMGRL